MIKPLPVCFLFVIAMPVMVLAQEKKASKKENPDPVHFQNVRMFVGNKMIDQTDVLIGDGVILAVGEDLATSPRRSRHQGGRPDIDAWPD